MPLATPKLIADLTAQRDFLQTKIDLIKFAQDWLFEPIDSKKKKMIQEFRTKFNVPKAAYLYEPTKDNEDLNEKYDEERRRLDEAIQAADCSYIEERQNNGMLFQVNPGTGTFIVVTITKSNVHLLEEEDDQLSQVTSGRIMLPSAKTVG